MQLGVCEAVGVQVGVDVGVWVGVGVNVALAPRRGVSEGVAVGAANAVRVRLTGFTVEVTVGVRLEVQVGKGEGVTSSGWAGANINKRRPVQ
jgi:hypothetical protein